MTTQAVCAVALVGVALLAAPAERPAPTKIQVADGIFLFKTASYGDAGLDGNSVVILSSDGVLVFDTNGTPSAAAAVLAEIRKLTTQPVRYIVNSHWHWDHWYGTEVYQRAFPDVRIIAHEKTRELMMGPALDFNRPGIEEQLPGYIHQLEQAIAAGSAKTPLPANLPRLQAALDDARFFLDQKAHVTHVFPNVTYTTEMRLFFGGREVQIRHDDRAVTPGDTYLYLPKERLVITGDLLVNPISFALSCYPAGWLKTLERLDTLAFDTIVPGHGDPLHDRELLHATMDLFRELMDAGKTARAKGLDPDQARESIMPGLAGLRDRITKGDPKLNDAFAIQLVDWFLHRVYEELDGPLSDAIARIPPK